MGLSVDQRLVIAEEKIKTMEALLVKTNERVKALETTVLEESQLEDNPGGPQS